MNSETAGFATNVAVFCIATVSTSAFAEPRLDLFGDPAPVAAATRAISIKPDTRWVNVTGGETIAFIVGDQSFGWSFNVSTTLSSFLLNRVAPPGLLDHAVTAYIAPDPKYIGGDGDRP